MKQGYNSRLDESLGARNGKKTQSLKDRRDESKGAKKGAGKRAYSSVSTMDKPKIKQKFRKDGTVRKTVTRTKGGVEKEIERGRKRIDVRKYKDEGVKSRSTVKELRGGGKVRNEREVKKDPYQEGDPKAKLTSRSRSKRDADGLLRRQFSVSRYKDEEEKTRFGEREKYGKDKDAHAQKYVQFGKAKRSKNITDRFGVAGGDLKKRVVERGGKVIKNVRKDSQTKIKKSIKDSAFRNMPHSMVEMASRPENNVLPANQMDKMEQKKNQPMTDMLNRESKKQRKENFS